MLRFWCFLCLNFSDITRSVKEGFCWCDFMPLRKKGCLLGEPCWEADGQGCSRVRGAIVWSGFSANHCNFRPWTFVPSLKVTIHRNLSMLTLSFLGLPMCSHVAPSWKYRNFCVPCILYTHHWKAWDLPQDNELICHMPPQLFFGIPLVPCRKSSSEVT